MNNIISPLGFGGRAVWKVLSVFVALTLAIPAGVLIAPLETSAVAPPDDTYSITGSATVLGMVATANGTASVSGSGVNQNTIHIAIDWNEDQGATVDIQTTAPEVLTGSTVVIPTCSGSCSVTWGPIDHDYSGAGSGTYKAFAIVYHGGLPGNDGIGSSQIAEITIVIPPSDTEGPTVAITSPANSAVTGPTGTITYTVGDSVSVACTLDTISVSCSTAGSYAFTLSSGSHTFTVQGTDSVGNAGNVASVTWTVDATGPVVTITSPASSDVTTGSGAITYTVGDSATVTCKLDGSTVACDLSGSFAFTGLTSGAHEFTVQGTDTYGNVGSEASRTWTVDMTPPDTTITAGPSGTVSTASAEFMFTSTESPSTFECKLDGADYAPCTAPVNYTSLSDGSHTFSVRATDALGNTDPTPATRTWTIDTTVPPTPTEDTLELCSDEQDNDSDDLVDLDDPDCAAYIPTLTVNKVVEDSQVGIGDLSRFTSSFFDIFVDLTAIVQGEATQMTLGSHAITESGADVSIEYTQAWSDSCADGQVTLGAGDNVTCTLTNTITTPFCADGLDNDDDGLTDSEDPGCWTDPNDSETYNSEDTDETTPADVCSNISGIQVTIPQGLVEGSEGTCVEPESSPTTGSIQATKFNDLNSNGEWDENELAISDWTICLHEAVNIGEGGFTEGDQIGDCQQTGEGGSTTFSSLAPGTYYVDEANPSGWTNTTGNDPAQKTVSAGNTATVTFGNHETDVCPNLQGAQHTVPEGYTSVEGQCVANEVTPPPSTPPASPPPSGGGGGSYGTCNDGLDNDLDGKTDLFDPQCLNSSMDEGTPPPPPSGQVLGASVVAPPEGQVLGESTTEPALSCSEVYLTDYIMWGRKHNPEQVTKLQTFLNEFMGANLPVTGFYGKLTRKAVMDFQLKYWEEILAPWVPFGLETPQTPTGHVYKTTKWYINKLKCDAAAGARPQLP